MVKVLMTVMVIIMVIIVMVMYMVIISTRIFTWPSAYKKNSAKATESLSCDSKKMNRKT